MPIDERGAALTRAYELIANDFSTMLGGANFLKAGRTYLVSQLGSQHPYLRVVQTAGDGKLVGP